MHLWESSSIHLLKGCTFKVAGSTAGQPTISIMSAVRSGQSRPTELQMELRIMASDLGCHWKIQEGEGVVSVHKSPWPNI